MLTNGQYGRFKRLTNATLTSPSEITLDELCKVLAGTLKENSKDKWSDGKLKIARSCSEGKNDWLAAAGVPDRLFYRQFETDNIARFEMKLRREHGLILDGPFAVYLSHKKNKNYKRQYPLCHERLSAIGMVNPMKEDKQRIFKTADGKMKYNPNHPHYSFEDHPYKNPDELYY